MSELATWTNPEPQTLGNVQSLKATLHSGWRTPQPASWHQHVHRDGRQRLQPRSVRDFPRSDRPSLDPYLPPRAAPILTPLSRPTSLCRAASPHRRSARSPARRLRPLSAPAPSSSTRCAWAPPPSPPPLAPRRAVRAPPTPPRARSASDASTVFFAGDIGGTNAASRVWRTEKGETTLVFENTYGTGDHPTFESAWRISTRTAAWTPRGDSPRALQSPDPLPTTEAT